MYITQEDIDNVTSYVKDGVEYTFDYGQNYENYAKFFGCPTSTMYRLVRQLGWEKSMFKDTFNRVVFKKCLNNYSGITSIVNGLCYYYEEYGAAHKSSVLFKLENEGLHKTVDELQTTLNRAMGEIQRLSDKLNERAAFAEPSDSAKELKFWKDYAWHLHQSYSNYLIMNTEKDAYEVVTQLEDFEHEFDGHRSFL